LNSELPAFAEVEEFQGPSKFRKLTRRTIKAAGRRADLRASNEDACEELLSKSAGNRVALAEIPDNVPGKRCGWRGRNSLANRYGAAYADGSRNGAAARGCVGPGGGPCFIDGVKLRG